MVRGAPRIALLAGLLLSGPLVAFAQSDDWTACTKTSGAVAMAACDRAISSGELTGRALALAYSNRGDEWTARGDLARAIADYDQAIQHDPSQAAAFHSRAIVLESRGQYVAAITATIM
jgi:Tfp pilus assembly protein PilF